MNCVNLLPQPRRQASAQRRVLRFWACVILGYSVLLAAVTAVGRLVRDPAASSEQQLRAAAQRVEQSEKAVAAIRPQVAAAQTDVAAQRQVSRQADWSRLLVLLGEAMDDEVVLSDCQLSAVLPGKPDKRSVEPPVCFSLKLAGLARTQLAVSRFVLALEKTGLFSTVRLVETSREPFLNDSAVSFHVECALGHETTGGS